MASSVERSAFAGNRSLARLGVVFSIVSVLDVGSAAPPALAADWTPVAPGIEYREETLRGPVKVYVARADRTKPGWAMESMIAKGTARGATETVPDMAARYDEAVNGKGERYDVKIAVNGDYYNMTTGVPAGGQLVDGWFVRRFSEYGGGSGLVWTADRRLFVGGNVRNAPNWQKAIFADKAALKLDKLNDPPGRDELSLYTWHYAAKTEAIDDAFEVVVRMSAPVCIMPENGGVTGEITAVRPAGGATPLLYDHVVLSGRGKAAAELKRRAKQGEAMKIALTLTDYGNEELGLKVADWRGAWSGIAGATYIVVNGKVPRHWEKKAERLAKEGKKHGSVVQDPRTLVAINDRYLYFVVADGRSKESIGMTFTEAGEFCAQQLKATFALTQDGGGSSTMWVDGTVRNTPSGKIGLDKFGALRPVANGLLMAIVQPAKRSDAFASATGVRVKEALDLRLGPGSQFAAAGTIAAGAEGMLVRHSLNGVFAKGSYWWCCRFGETEGWAAEGQLSAAK